MVRFLLSLLRNGVGVTGHLLCLFISICTFLFSNICVTLFFGNGTEDDIHLFQTTALRFRNKTMRCEESNDQRYSPKWTPRMCLQGECSHTEDIYGRECEEQFISEVGHHGRRDFRNHKVCATGITVS